MKNKAFMKIYQLFLLSFLLLGLLTLTGCLDDLNAQLKCEHNYVKTEIVGECGHVGSVSYTCTKCEREVTIREMIEHNWETTGEVASTCTTKGHKIIKCSNCGEERTEELELAAHNYEVVEDVASTCAIKGHKTEKCTVCEHIETTEYDFAAHQYEEIENVDSSCKEEGHITKKCTACEHEEVIPIEKKAHTFGDWELEIEFVDAYHDQEKRECSVCHEKETRLVDSIYKLDTTILEYNYTAQTNYTANTFEETCTIFNVAILNKQAQIKIELKYDTGDFDKFFDNLCNSKEIPFDYKVESSLQSSMFKKELTLTFTYYNNPTQATTDDAPYEQYNSLNVTTATSTRASDYDDFGINKAALSYSVSTTDQLVYVLEKRVKPIPVPGSIAETVYNKMKEVLRQIINDDMNEYEKTKAIHDWLVMNVTYDKALLVKLENNDESIKSYNGFYLEGVFIDHFAVCDGISKALCAMANIEGIPCVRISGHETGVLDGVGHAWNKIYVEKHWYVIDATSDGTIINGSLEVLSYAYFLISDEKMKARYTGEDYTTYACENNYDAFDKMKYTYNENEYTLKVNSQAELNQVIAYAKANITSKCTIQIYLAFDFGASFNDEFQAAYLANGIYSGYSIVDSGNLVMMVKE